MITPNTVINPGALGFLVKNWSFGTPSGSGHYPYVLWVEAVDLVGIPGEYNLNPPGPFENHWVSRYSGEIYDPSYGAGAYASENGHENAAIDGSFTFISPSYWARQQLTGTQELIYTVWP